MDAQQFSYWLQGFAELTDKAPTDEQWQSIREHLALVFAKVTPPLTQFRQFSGLVTDQLARPHPPAYVACDPISPLTIRC